MQSVSSRIWTRVAVSISYDDNDYTAGTSKMKWYSPTDIISLTLWVLRPKFVLLLTEILQNSRA